MRRGKYILIYIFTGLYCLLSSCIKPFEPVGVKDTAGILVVEGMILEAGTTIKLSRTVKLNEKLRDSSRMVFVNDAHVCVIDNQSTVVANAEQQIINGKVKPGEYIVQSKILFTPGKKYALDIRIEDKHYQSAFVSPVSTPNIDEISWKFYGDNSMDIMVSTHDPEGKIHYYRWAYEEDWEIRATFFGEAIFDLQNFDIIKQDIKGPNNKYYCWDSNVSKSILLGASDKLTEAVIKNKRILRIPPLNTRFSYLYSILVRQYAIDKEAYLYFDNIQKNIDQGGSFFAPQPNEIRGNIKCLSNPEEPVVGYVVATKEVASRIFINMEKNEGEDFHNCWEQFEFTIPELPIAYYNEYGIISLLDEDIGLYLCAPVKCVDCTRRGGTKNKPDFWPNDHQ